MTERTTNHDVDRPQCRQNQNVIEMDRCGQWREMVNRTLGRRLMNAPTWMQKVLRGNLYPPRPGAYAEADNLSLIGINFDDIGPRPAPTRKPSFRWMVWGLILLMGVLLVLSPLYGAGFIGGLAFGVIGAMVWNAG
jgi:hypothetical protein